MKTYTHTIDTLLLDKEAYLFLREKCRIERIETATQEQLDKCKEHWSKVFDRIVNRRFYKI